MSHLQEQLEELEFLDSMFSIPGEFEIEDRASFDQGVAFLKNLAPDPPKCLSCRLCIPISAHRDSEDVEGEGDAVKEGTAEMRREEVDSHTVNISLRLPTRYPDVSPEVYVSANDLQRGAQDLLNSSLHEYSSSLTLGEASLLLHIDWVREHAHSFFPPTPVHNLEPESDLVPGSDSHFCRMWLYMHHIYSKTKRRNILALADQLQLSGFCLPGKPGVVCVEGTVYTTREFYNTLRRWNWKSIACRKREEEASMDVIGLRRIEGFSELNFDVRGPRQGHMDMGQFLDYLRRYRMEYMFKELFGVDGHLSM